MHGAEVGKSRDQKKYDCGKPIGLIADMEMETITSTARIPIPRSGPADVLPSPDHDDMPETKARKPLIGFANGRFFAMRHAAAMAIAPASNRPAVSRSVREIRFVSSP